MQKTAIGWAVESWNPVHGCSRVSAGCDNCYAERRSHRYGHTDAEWTPENAAKNVLLQRHKLGEPYDLDEPSRVFVNSMGDLFHSWVPDEYVRDVFAVMRNCPEHVFQILTKRPGRAADMALHWPPNVWMGTSVEDDRVTERLDLLRPCDAELLFVSFEPLIGDVGRVDLRGYDWVIVGGESGPGYRGMENDWVRNIYRQCREQDAAFFFKQSAAYHPETRPRFAAFNPEWGVYEERRVREIPDPHPAVEKARNAWEAQQEESIP